MINEIKIPEGHKATILGGTIRIEPMEEKAKFKRGDFIKLDCINPDYAISIVDYVDDKGKIYVLASTGAKCAVQIAENKDWHVGYINESGNKHILANEAQRQFMLKGLKGLGKYWDAEALEVKDFIKVPENIGIYKWFGEDEEYKCGDNLFIGFNNDKQLLGYDDTNKCYLTYPKRNAWQKIQCYLQPCKREDLQSGDTAFFSPTFRLSEDITSDLGRYVKIVGKANYKTNKSGEIVQERNHAEWWYKLIPINK